MNASESTPPFNLCFLASLPRSGSTLLQCILSNNPEVASTAEPWLLLPYIGLLKPGLVESKYDTPSAHRAIKAFMEKVGKEAYLGLLRKHFYEVYGLIATAQTKVILDKTPRYYEILDELHDVFPKKKIMLLKRHPLAVLSSMIDTFHIKDIPGLSFYARDLLYGPHLLDAFCKKHERDADVKVLRYEDFVSSPQKTTEQLCAFLGVSFCAESINYSENRPQRGDAGDPAGIFKHDVPVTDSLHRWKSKFADPYWGPFFRGYAHYLGPQFLKDYGDYDVPEARPSMRFRYFDWYMYSGMYRWEVSDARHLKSTLISLLARSCIGLQTRFQRLFKK